MQYDVSVLVFVVKKEDEKCQVWKLKWLLQAQSLVTGKVAHAAPGRRSRLN